MGKSAQGKSKAAEKKMPVQDGQIEK